MCNVCNVMGMDNTNEAVPEFIEVELSDFFDDSEPDDGRTYDDEDVSW